MSVPSKSTNLLNRLETKSIPLQMLIVAVLIGVIGIVDFLTGYELAFSLFYVLPISLMTWFTNKKIGLASAFASATVWLCADLASGSNYSNPFIPVWNTFIRLSFFVIIALLLSALKTAMKHEEEMARTDFLTGAYNSRVFFSLAQREIDLLRRYKHPFTLAYIDLDNFKTINDQFGHIAGDNVLRCVVTTIKGILRRTDFIARVGGDEFVMFFPETGQEAASLVLSRIQAGLLEKMGENSWPITFSMGVITCVTAPKSPDELLKLADDLMYLVKRDGKNSIRYFTYDG